MYTYHKAQWYILQGKVHRLTPKILWQVQCEIVPIWLLHISPTTHFLSFHSTIISLFWLLQLKSNHMHTTYTTKTQNFHPFRSVMILFPVTPPFWGKVHRMTPDAFDMFKVKNTMLHTLPDAQIFGRSFYDEPLSSYGPFLERCTEWPQITLTCSRSKIPTCMLYTPPEAHIVCRFALRWAVFELRANFRKSVPNDPKWPWHDQGQQYHHACYIHPLWPKFCPFLSTMSRFFSYGSIFEKLHRMALNDLNMFKVKNIIMHAIYTPRSPFLSVSLYDEPFLS